MKRKIKIVFLCLLIYVGIVILSGCAESTNNNDKIKILCTNFSEYDWARTIIGENNDKIEVSMLGGKGADLHNYQPTAEDIIQIKGCDLFIYVGGESDEWLDKILEDKNKSQCISLIEILGEDIKTEEIVEGMQEEDDAWHLGGHDEELDEHVWLSLKNAQKFVLTIQDKIINLDLEHKKEYEKNGREYIEKLNDLDNRYKNMVSLAKKNTLLFADRFPFRYMIEDYGLKYYAAFVGCSSETEASFETIAFLSEKVVEENISYVLVIEKSDEKIAESVINNSKKTNAGILEMNSLQSISGEEMDKGISYISVMEANLDVLSKVLN